jgi:hypothetical protein
MANTTKGKLDELIGDIANLLSITAEEATSLLIKAETDKIQSILEESSEAAHHFHSNECWVGKASIPNVGVHEADKDSLTPFVLDSGNNNWGTAICVLGSGDTPCAVGSIKFDFHRILITATERTNEPYIIRMAFGETEAAAIAAGNVSSTMIYPTAQVRTAPIIVQSKRIPVGSKLWMNCKCASNTGTINLFIGLHEYTI